MIRLSNNNDINGIITLWKEAFGDSDEDIKFFLSTHYKPENTVVYDSEGIIASVLFLLEGEMHINGVDYSSYYLYAACTLKNFRGRGIMSQMLEFSECIASERNKKFIALKPAEASLYDYYSRFGYKSVFSKKIISIEKTDNNEYVESDNLNNNYASPIRDNVYDFINYFKWDNSSVNFAIEHQKYFGGNIIQNRNGYLLYSINDKIIYVNENTFSAIEFKKHAFGLLNKHSADKIIAELPVDFTFDENNFEIIKSGMLLPLCEKAEKLIENIDNAYLALTLD